MLTDLRFAMRIFTRTPGFTALAVFTLAVGIGGASSVFSLFRAVFLTPLPFPDPQRIVSISERRLGSRNADIPVSGHEYEAWRAQNASFDNIALYRPERLNLTGNGDPELVPVVRASSDYFAVFGLTPALGRTFASGEDQPGGSRVAILSDESWRQRFGADPTAIGKTIVLNDEPFTVVGVLAPLPRSISTHIWLPLDVREEIRALGRHNLSVVARLKPGVAVAQAQSDLAAISERLSQQLPAANTGHHVRVAGLRDRLVGDYRGALTLLLAAVSFVLLIACANLANLLLTRGADRQREMAVRAAIGAGRGRLIRQLLIESLLLGILGGSAGLLLAVWIVDLIPKLAAVDIPLLETARVDPYVIGVAAALAVITGIAIGIAPALRISRPDTSRALVAGQRISEDRSGRRLRSLLVGSEVAWTLVLLVGAGLMLNSFVRLLHVNPGFDTKNVAVVPVDLPGTRYADAERRRNFVDELLVDIRSLPGVTEAGAVSNLPLGGSDNWMPFAIAGRPAPAVGQELYAAFRVATTDYFRAMGIPLRAGRFFSDADRRLSIPVIRWFPQQPQPALANRSQAPPIVVISEHAARQFWPGQNPIGERIRVLFSPEMLVVGVVADVKHNALDAPASPHIYIPHSQEPWGSLSVVVKTSVPPQSLATALRERVRALDERLPVAVGTMEGVRAGTVAQQRFYLLLIGLFGLVALALAVVGIVGVVSFSASQRTTEIGVRLALGAVPQEIIVLVLSQSLRPIVAGLAAGVAGALTLSRFIEKMLYGVRPADPLTFAAVAVLLMLAAIVACWIPARRASRLDPVVALRAL